MFLTHLNWLAVIVAAIVFFVFGGIWYGAIFGKAWEQAVGKTKEEFKKGASAAYITGFITSIIMAYTLARVIAFGHVALGGGILYGFFFSFGLIVMVLLMNTMFNRSSMKLFWINAFYQVIGCMIMGAILGAWK